MTDTLNAITPSKQLAPATARRSDWRREALSECSCFVCGTQDWVFEAYEVQFNRDHFYTDAMVQFRCKGCWSIYQINLARKFDWS